jgi:biotin transport system substrate-specific component
MVALLAGAVLGGINGAAALLLFLVAGAIGAPVFSGFRGGIAILLGPTGGYLIGYLVGAFITGLILGVASPSKKEPKLAMVKIALAGLAGFLVIFIFGIPWLAKVAGISLKAAIVAGVFPYLPGLVIKMIIFVPVTFILRPIAARYINPDE